jgi:hypothetical protein
MLPFEMSSPVVLSSKTTELPVNCGKAADVMTKIPLIAIASLVAKKVFHKGKCKVLRSARTLGTSEWFRMVFLVATAQRISI